MGMTAKIMRGQVMHKRLSPKVNAFQYGIYYLALPLQRLAEKQKIGWLGINRPGLLSFHDRDHGDRQGGALLPWIRDILDKYDAADIDGEVVLVAMPRTLGYVFNPISFWLCYDRDEKLRAILCEVNNTFGENHSYLCIHDDHREITADDWFISDKLFHVSPFMQRTGLYRFRFAITDKNFGAWIDYEEVPGEKKLLTMLTGKLTPLDAPGLRQVFWQYPLVSLRATFLIHWQALKLVMRGIRYISKPLQLQNRLDRARDAPDITNN